MRHVDLVGLHVEVSGGMPLVLLREQDAPHRVLPIVIGPTEAAAIAFALSDRLPPRPATHDLMVTLVDVLEAHVDRVEVTELRDGAFVAELAVSSPAGQRRLDSRASDAIALAVRVDAPLYVSDAVLNEAGASLTEEPGEEEIEEEVARFRSLLDALDPAELQTGLLGEPSAGASEPDQPDGPPDDGADTGIDDEPDTDPGEASDSPDA